MIFNTIIFFLLSFLFFISLIGYGNLIRLNNFKDTYLQNSLNFFVGLIFLNVIGFVFYYLNIKNSSLNFLILLFGLFFFDYKTNKKLLVKYLFIHLILFSGLLISKLHEDWSYHFNFIEQITNHGPIIGIGNVEDIHVLSTSFFSFTQKIFYLPIINFNYVFIPIYLVYINLIALLFYLTFFFKEKSSIICLMILTLIMIKISRFSEFGYDYIANFLLIYLLIIFLLSHDKKINNFIGITFFLFIYAITIKITSLFFLPIIFYFFFKNKSYNFNFTKESILSYILIVFFISENFLRSGCLLYFIELSCINHDLISWKIDFDRVANHSNHVELWTKGFYHQQLFNNPDEYLKFGNWFSNWFKIHFFYKVFEFILIPLLFLIFICIKGKFTFINKNIYFIFSCFTSLLIWFFLMPQLRFGSAIIVSFFISLMIPFSNFDQKIIYNKKIILSFLLTLCLIYNVKNINRIKNEFNRNDDYKFINFPFPPEKKLQIRKIGKNNIKYGLYANKRLKNFKWFKVIY